MPERTRAKGERIWSMKRKERFDGGSVSSGAWEEDVEAERDGGPSPSKDGAHGGLCSTCNDRRVCAFRKIPGRPVLFCEGFDCSAPPGISVDRPSLGEQIGETEGDPPHMEGLCFNCDLRETCTLPRAEGGVWYCEEYT